MKRPIVSLALGAALANGALCQPVAAVRLLKPISADAVSGASVVLMDASGCLYSGRIGHDVDAHGLTQSGAPVQLDTVWDAVVVEPRCVKPALLPGTVIPLPRPPSAEQSSGERGYRPGTELALTRN